MQGAHSTNPRTKVADSIGGGLYAGDWTDIGDAIILDNDPTNDLDWVDQRMTFVVDANDFEQSYEYYRFRFEVGDGSGTERPWADATWLPIALYPI